MTGGAGFIGSHYVRSSAVGRLGTGRAGLRGGARQAHLRRQPGQPRAGPRRPAAPLRRGRHPRPARSSTSWWPRPTRSCTSPPSRHVDRSILGAADFVMTNVVGTQTLLDAALRHGVETVRARLHRRGLRLDRRRAPGTRSSRWSRTRRTPRPRPPATCSPAPTTAPTGCRSASPAARTTTGPTSSRRRSSRCSSPT